MKIPRTKEELAKLIDHTNVKPMAKRDDIIKLVEEAKKYKFRGVCVSPTWIPLVSSLLAGEDIHVIAVIGFPFGYSPTETKVSEAIWVKKHGATEIDVVMNISAFKSREFDLVEDDLRKIIEAVHPIPVKVIIETSYLTSDEIMEAAKICVRAGAHFVKTNTGFGPRGASLEDIKLIRKAIGNKAKIKAAGGIRNAETALRFIAHGADVIGSSSGIAIIESFSPEIIDKILASSA